MASFPDENVVGWKERALRHLLWAIAFLVLAISLKRNSSASLIVILLASAIISFAYPEARELLYIDKCLDSGGRWNYDKYLCER